MSQFMGAYLAKKQSSHLSSIIQKENKSLIAYVQRFIEEMIQVDGYINDRAMKAM